MEFKFTDCGNMPMPESKEDAVQMLADMMKKQYEERMKREDGVIRGKTLNENAAEVHRNAVEHGWWNPQPSFEAVIALCHSELSEALEARRNNEPLAWVDDGKPEGIATEMIDCVAGIDYASTSDWVSVNLHFKRGNNRYDISHSWICSESKELKHLYNTTRPYRHGDKAL